MIIKIKYRASSKANTETLLIHYSMNNNDKSRGKTREACDHSKREKREHALAIFIHFILLHNCKIKCATFQYSSVCIIYCKQVSYKYAITPIEMIPTNSVVVIDLCLGKTRFISTSKSVAYLMNPFLTKLSACLALIPP